MKTNILKLTAFLLIMAGSFSSCNKDISEENEINNEEEYQPIDWDKKLHFEIDDEDIGKTIPIVNKFLNNLPSNLNDEQRAQELVTWFKSHSCIVDARIIPPRDVAFSFRDGEVIRELILNFSTTNKVLSYRYDLYNGISVKTNKSFTINKVFDLINSLDLDVELINYGTYVSNMPSDNLQFILNNLNSKPYINDAVWPVYGYLHYLTNQITVFPRLYNMKNKNYQADWLKSMDEYKLVENFISDNSGYVIQFRFPEMLDNYWKVKFEEYDFVEWAELRCNRYTIFDNSIDSDNESDVNVDSKINIRLVEIYDKSPRTLQLRFATEKMYPCANYPIIVSSQQLSNNIDISFKGVVNNIGICLTAIGPATATINLGALSNGTYNLNFYNGNVKHTGKLIISSDSYAINFANNELFNFTNAPLNRIPEHTIWGTIGYHKQETSSLVQSFIDALINLGAEKKAYNPGYYNEYVIDTNGDIVQPGENSGYWFARSFIFHFSKDIANVEQLVKQYARDYGNDYMYISVYTDKGEQFLSWMY